MLEAELYTDLSGLYLHHAEMQCFQNLLGWPYLFCFTWGRRQTPEEVFSFQLFHVRLWPVWSPKHTVTQICSRKCWVVLLPEMERCTSHCLLSKRAKKASSPEHIHEWVGKGTTAWSCAAVPHSTLEAVCHFQTRPLSWYLDPYIT